MFLEESRIDEILPEYIGEQKLLWQGHIKHCIINRYKSIIVWKCSCIVGGAADTPNLCQLFLSWTKNIVKVLGEFIYTDSIHIGEYSSLAGNI